MLKLPNGEKIRFKESVVIGRYPEGLEVVIYKDNEGPHIAEVYDQAVSRYEPEDEKYGSFIVKKEGDKFYGGVPKTAKNPVVVRFDEKNIEVKPGEGLPLPERCKLRIGMHDYELNLRSKLFVYSKELLEEIDKLWVLGDIHGDLNALESALEKIDLKRDGLILLGDYADRGEHGVEVIEKVGELIRDSDKVVALKGNHEDYRNGDARFYPCDLISEVEEKRGSWKDYYKDKFEPFVEELYLAAIIPGEILFVHGGVSSRIISEEDLKHPTEGIENDVMWSDPTYQPGERANRRGTGVEFGPDITEKVCKHLNVKKIIRSHEPRKAPSGPVSEHGGKVVTLSATSAYGGRPFALCLDAKNPSKFETLFL